MNIRNRVTEMRLMSPKDISFNEKNWRTHPDKQNAALTAILENIGIAGAMLCYYSERNGGKLTLIDGHLRKEIAPGEQWPVLITDLSDSEADTLLAAYDPISAMAGADKERLDSLLREVHVDDARLQEMLADLAKDNGLYQTGDNKDAEPQIDRAEELRVKWGVESGQLWELGEHRLLCGDSTKVDDVALVMGGEKAVMLFTDPPYGVSYADKNVFLNAIWPANRVEKDIKGDHQTPKEMSDFWKCAFVSIRQFLHPGASYYVTGPQGGDLLLLLLLALRESGFPLHHMIIWAKNQFVIGRSDYHYQHEPVIYGWVEGAGHKFYGDRGESSLWQINKPHNSDNHPTMKPVELYDRGIKNSSQPGTIILEPFSGSGTAIIACENLGRKCRAIEIDPGYVAVALQRWADATGKTPKLIE